ncbi:hypothetical protein [Mesorhizobium sp. M0047]|uniref:hypothetical protein n=1 Tax=unclassified Mesorhizobium TaxID=325217 RepID=UPI00333D5A1A
MFKLAAMTLAAVLIAGAALAHKEATGTIAERMTAMKNMGRELKASERSRAAVAGCGDRRSVICALSYF